MVWPRAAWRGNFRRLSDRDSWAAVDITVAADNAFVHELVGITGNGGSLLRLWGEGFLSGHCRAGRPQDQSQTHYSNIRGLNHAMISVARRFGMSGRVPIFRR